jgi:hypothetical protein
MLTNGDILNFHLCVLEKYGAPFVKKLFSILDYQKLQI